MDPVVAANPGKLRRVASSPPTLTTASFHFRHIVVNSNSGSFQTRPSSLRLDLALLVSLRIRVCSSWSVGSSTTFCDHVFSPKLLHGQSSARSRPTSLRPTAHVCSKHPATSATSVWPTVVPRYSAHGLSAESPSSSDRIPPDARRGTRSTVWAVWSIATGTIPATATASTTRTSCAVYNSAISTAAAATTAAGADASSPANGNDISANGRLFQVISIATTCSCGYQIDSELEDPKYSTFFHNGVGSGQV
jgi:hypothetical protein